MVTINKTKMKNKLEKIFTKNYTTGKGLHSFNIQKDPKNYKFKSQNFLGKLWRDVNKKVTREAMKADVHRNI